VLTSFSESECESYPFQPPNVWCYSVLLLTLRCMPVLINVYLGMTCRFLKHVSAELREAGLRCAEKIVAWVLAVSASSSEPALPDNNDDNADQQQHQQQPIPFLWQGQDYLLKVCQSVLRTFESIRVYCYLVQDKHYSDRLNMSLLRLRL
jgi:hypothetical protein